MVLRPLLHALLMSADDEKIMLLLQFVEEVVQVRVQIENVFLHPFLDLLEKELSIVLPVFEILDLVLEDILGEVGQEGGPDALVPHILGDVLQFGAIIVHILDQTFSENKIDNVGEHVLAVLGLNDQE